MKLKKLSVIALASLGLGVAAHANEVLLAANQPMKITFRIAHKNSNSPAVFGELQSLDVNKNVNIPVALNNYDRAGIIIVSANGIPLPPFANQFNQPKQCSMTTDNTKSTGALEFTLSQRSISCRSYGGVFG